jgi:hypothetical protein
MRRRTGNQCRSRKMGAIWSNFQYIMTNRTVAFWTDWNFVSRPLVTPAVAVVKSTTDKWTNQPLRSVRREYLTALSWLARTNKSGRQQSREQTYSVGCPPQCQGLSLCRQTEQLQTATKRHKFPVYQATVEFQPTWLASSQRSASVGCCPSRTRFVQCTFQIAEFQTLRQRHAYRRRSYALPHHSQK